MKRELRELVKQKENKEAGKYVRKFDEKERINLRFIELIYLYKKKKKLQLMNSKVAYMQPYCSHVVIISICGCV